MGLKLMDPVACAIWQNPVPVIAMAFVVILGQESLAASKARGSLLAVAGCARCRNSLNSRRMLILDFPKLAPTHDLARYVVPKHEEHMGGLLNFLQHHYDDETMPIPRLSITATI